MAPHPHLCGTEVNESMSHNPNIVEVHEADFGRTVIEESARRPVLVDFWADWCNPCKVLMPVLGRLAEDYDGGFLLAKVNTEIERELAAQQDIRSLPTLRLYRDGKVVDEILGAQPESAIRAMLDPWIVRKSDESLEQALQTEAEGRGGEALALLEQAWRDDPDNPRLPFELIRLAIAENRPDTAQEVLDSLPAALQADPRAASFRTLIGFARDLANAPDTASLREQLESHPDDSETRYRLAARQLLGGRYDEALEQFMELLKRDRGFRDGAARRGLLATFEMIGADDPRVADYRRRMFALLH